MAKKRSTPSLNQANTLSRGGAGKGPPGPMRCALWLTMTARIATALQPSKVGMRPPNGSRDGDSFPSRCISPDAMVTFALESATISAVTGDGEGRSIGRRRRRLSGRLGHDLLVNLEKLG